ncbi:hypothetical protein ACFWNR_28445 [Streptomyces virginiae]|uniref:hypothetical protein n=1 Tax=Streptomyces virginiae TaxID=1961 RepID=UPI003667283A
MRQLSAAVPGSRTDRRFCSPPGRPVLLAWRHWPYGCQDWIRRRAGPGPDRTRVHQYGPARTTMADPALVELAIGPDTDEAAGAQALRLLGFPADLPVRVVAVRARLPLDKIGSLLCPGRLVKAASLGDVGVVLATTVDITEPAGLIRASLALTAWRLLDD